MTLHQMKEKRPFFNAMAESDTPKMTQFCSVLFDLVHLILKSCIRV